MKIIKYQIMTEVNHGTEENPDIVKSIRACETKCSDEKFESNYAIVLEVAYNGEVTVEEVEDEETPAPSVESSVWDELDAAYQEGVDSV